MEVVYNNLICLMVAIPMATAILAIALRGAIVAQRAIGVVSLATLAGLGMWFTATLPDSTNIFVSRMGAWELPFGIAVAIDGVSGPLLAVTAVIGLACFVGAWRMVEPRVERGWFHPLFHFLVMGVNFSFLTADLFNLFVAFEIMLMASYALLVVQSTRPQLAQAYKYLALNLVASTIFVFGAGLLYGLVGTLNFADLARIVQESRTGGAPLPAGFQAVAVLLIFVFAAKSAMFPLWFWLPDVYPTLTGSIAAMFTALLSKVGVYAVLRTYPLILSGGGNEGGVGAALASILPVVAGATMILGILGAVGSTSIRRLLAFVLMSHVGYLVFGIVVGTPASMGGALLYMGQEMLVMAGLMLCCGVVERHAGTDDLRRLGGLYGRAPVLSGIMLVLLLSLCGMPPMPGFFGKAVILREGLAQGHWVLAGLTVATAILTLVAALRVWCHGFWMSPRSGSSGAPEGAELVATPRVAWALLGAGLVCASAITIGLGAPKTIPMTQRAALNLAEPQRFIDGTLGAPEPGVRSVATAHGASEDVR